MSDLSAFPLSLSLFNFLPVALTGLALWLLTRYTANQDPSDYRLALLGAVLILAGGLAKASWKLIAATTGTDLVWLANALFPLMAPGFALLAVALWGAVLGQRRRPVPVGLWQVALAAVAITFAAAALRHWLLQVPRGRFLPLLVLASLGNLAASLLLIGAALSIRWLGTALLFAVNLLMIFALQPIAMMNPKTLAMHCTEQSLTALGTACFALAAYRLWRLTSPERSAVRLGPNDPGMVAGSGGNARAQRPPPLHRRQAVAAVLKTLTKDRVTGTRPLATGNQMPPRHALPAATPVWNQVPDRPDGGN